MGCTALPHAAFRCSGSHGLALPHLTPPAWREAVPRIPSPFLAAEPFLSRVRRGSEPCCVRLSAGCAGRCLGWPWWLAAAPVRGVLAPQALLVGPQHSSAAGVWELAGEGRAPTASPLSAASSAAWWGPRKSWQDAGCSGGASGQENLPRRLWEVSEFSGLLQ